MLTRQKMIHGLAGAPLETLDHVSARLRAGASTGPVYEQERARIRESRDGDGGRSLLEQAGVSATFADGEADPGVVMGGINEVEQAVADFIKALGKHRHPARERAQTQR